MTGDRFEERRKECTSSPRSLARSPWRLGDRGSVCVAIVRPQDHGRFHSRPTGSKESSAGECVEERFVVPLFTMPGQSSKVKKVLKLAKGYRGRSKNTFRTAVRRVQKAQQYAYVGRKLKKRTARKTWIQQINAGTRAYDMPYSSFINRLDDADVQLNRKVLADIAANEPYSFRSVISVLDSLSPPLARGVAPESTSLE